MLVVSFIGSKGMGHLLLILPGNTASSACHIGELEYFGQRYHTVALDFLGTGQSDRVAVWPDDWWEQGAYCAAALVEHLGQESCLVMGSSGGGIAALLLALLMPERVQAVIADSCVERLPAERLEAVVAERAQRTAEQIAFGRHAHGDDWQQVVDADSDLMLRFSRSGGDWFQGRLNEISCPVLLTASLTDTALPNVGQQIGNMVERIPDSRAFLSNGGDHPLMWSRPEEFRRVSDCFLRSRA